MRSPDLPGINLMFECWDYLLLTTGPQTEVTEVMGLQLLYNKII